MDMEFGSSSEETRLTNSKFYRSTLCLAYQSFGVVYGDLITSPIYVYKCTFSGRLSLYEEDDEILGVLSLVFWTLTLIPLLKYIVFVLGAHDNGEGGTFALYSLLCKNSKMGLLSTYNAIHDCMSSCDDSETNTKETKTSILIKGFFEQHRTCRVVLLLVVVLGTGMVIGDGILTPSMSVLSAVYGIQIKIPDLHDDYPVVIACIILVGIFSLQHYGTHRVGFIFAPILLVWLLCISGIGIYNIFHWNPGVVRALSPYYIYNFFRKTRKAGWSSLGGIVLSITGGEAMFADLGHFSQLSIRIAFTGVVYPCLVLAYMGEAAYLSKHKPDVNSSFYKAIPEAIFWPTFIIATLATAVGSQAIISATFSIISQCRALNCFPRVKIIHTSNQIHGQIYIPEVNWMLMVLCLAVVIGFRDTKLIGKACGLSVISMMFITTCLMFLIISTIRKQNIFVALLFVIVFGSVEMLYFSACLAKIHQGGWLPLLISILILCVMSIWHYGTWKKHEFEIQNKVNLDNLLNFGLNFGITRVSGICLIYSNFTSGIPPMFAHFVTNFPAFHQILIFVNLQSLMVPKVPERDRFLVCKVGPPEYCIFKCIIRCGYKDVRDNYLFETQLIEKVAEFLKCEYSIGEILTSFGQSTMLSNRATVIAKSSGGSGYGKKVIELLEATESGVVYMMGNTYVVAKESSSFMKKFALNIVYGFLKRNCRRPATILGIPHISLIEIGMTYHV